MLRDKIATRLQEIQQKGGLWREAEVLGVDVEARTVELSFSSEVEVERWFGIEVLGHDRGEYDFARLNDSAPILWNHDLDDMRGVVEPGSARVDVDRKGRLLARYAKDEAGEQMLQRINDRIVTKVSVGYRVKGMKLVEERNDVDVYRINAWEPFEVSMVSVPADITVGVGRSLVARGEGPWTDPGLRSEEMPPEDAAPSSGNTAPVAADTGTRARNIMIEKVTRDAKGNLVRAHVDENGAIVEVLEVIEPATDEVRQGQQRGQEAERTRMRSITELGRQYGQTELALQAIADGNTAEEFQRMLLQKVTERSGQPLGEQMRDAEIGLSNQEVRQFSFIRAIRALLPNATADDRKAAAFELECSRAAEQKYTKRAKGILVPADVLNRAFSTTNPDAGPGSNIVAQQLLASSFIELLRNRAWVMRRATTLGGLVGNIDIPRQKGAAQAYWVGEGGAPNSSEPALDQVSFTPKSLAAFTDITRRLMLQSTPDAELIVRADLLQVMALQIDRAAIYGNGSTNQPKGVTLQTGINAVPFAAAGKPTFEELVEMETKIALGNADVESMAYAFNAGIRGYAKTALKFPGTAASGTIWEQGNTVNGYATSVSNQIEPGDVLFGNWADLIIAMWGGLDLTVDPYSLSTSGGTRIVVFQDVDFNIRHPESFCYGTAAAAH
ncbi:phage major capsid protein [Dyella sp. M7H15-1]|nr:phage major capsid protein [Dyella sp. M7H15-1]